MGRVNNRDRLLAAGSKVIHVNGFRMTSVKDITDAAGVPKGSFYNYFDNKDAFGLEVLERYADIHSLTLEKWLGDTSVPPRQRLEGLFEHWTANFRKAKFSGGCLAGNFCQEMADVDPTYRKAVDKVMERFRGYFTDCVSAAQAAGEIAGHENAEDLAEIIFFSWQGALLRMKASASDRPLVTFREQFLDRIFI